ncbi:MAG: D-aminoacyl-tRNA deacylase [Myxococcota bacterium]
MRAVVQRVRSARVSVAGEVVGAIGPGLVVLLGVGRGDAEVEAELLAEKIAELRIFADADDKMNRSLIEVGGACLVVSQFTLYADLRRGRRPFFGEAEMPERARTLVEHFAGCVAARGPEVARGVFGAMMQVELINDGPVTIVIDSREWQASRRT